MFVRLSASGGDGDGKKSGPTRPAFSFSSGDHFCC